MGVRLSNFDCVSQHEPLYNSVPNEAIELKETPQPSIRYAGRRVGAQGLDEKAADEQAVNSLIFSYLDFFVHF